VRTTFSPRGPSSEAALFHYRALVRARRHLHRKHSLNHERGLSLDNIEPIVVAAYVEQLAAGV